MTLSFAEIELTKHELQLLTNLNDGATPARSLEYDHLFSLKFVRYAFPGSGGSTQFVHIEPRGKDYLAYHEARCSHLTTETRRYWITTSIAVLALLKSFDRELIALAASLLRLLMQ